MRFCLFLFLVLLAFVTSCKKEVSEINATTYDYSTEIEQAKNVEILYSEEGKVRVKIKAPILVRHNTKDPYSEFPDGINGEFYNDNLQPTSYLKACYATKKEKQNEVYIYEDIEVLTSKGDMILTEKLVWQEKSKRIFSDTIVTIITKTEEITGTSFEATQDFSEYTIRNISGIKRVDKKQIRE